MVMGTLQFTITKNHPDYHVAEHHCYETRRLRNSINSLLRTNYFYYRHGEDASLDIADDYGVAQLARENKLGVNKAEWIRKLVTKQQQIDLPVKMAQSARISLVGSWRSFFELRKKGLPANIPGYSHTYHVAEYNPQTISKRGLKNGYVVPTGWSTGVKLPPDFTGKVKSARVKNAGSTFALLVLYEKASNNEPYEPISGLIAGIDPGLNNLLTIGFNDLREGIIIDGKPLKKINSYYNKMIAELTAKLDVEKRNISKKVNNGLTRDDEDYTRVYRPNSQRLANYWVKRDRLMKHYYTTATNSVTRSLCEAGVETVVIGWNPGNKQRVNMGRRNNRNFVQVPLKSILDDLARKLTERGVEVVFTEESYTSKSSFMDDDALPVYGENEPRAVFSGKRVRRGLYESSNGSLINADLNGALNIIRKYDQHFSYSGVVADPSVGTFAGTRSVVPSVRRLAFSY